jgi:hypothetical protein
MIFITSYLLQVIENAKTGDVYDAPVKWHTPVLKAMHKYISKN